MANSSHHKTTLITGVAGFIGSNFLKQYHTHNPAVNIVGLDKLTYAANLQDVEIDRDKYTFIHGDICDESLLINLFKQYKITDVINFAAETHVDNSISSPDVFIKTNISGTQTLLKVCYHQWMEGPEIFKPGFDESRFLQISTDEVYGSLSTSEAGFTESTALSPNSPYSASKASADLLVQSYNRTFGLKTLITRCSNNYGPNQHAEKLIPTIIRNALANSTIPIYGDGQNIRDWIDVRDHCDALECVFSKGKPGEIYNIGATNEHSNLGIAHMICAKLDYLLDKPKNSHQKLIKFVKDRPGHDYRYSVNSSKLSKELKYTATRSHNMESNIEQILKLFISRTDNDMHPQYNRVLS